MKDDIPLVDVFHQRQKLNKVETFSSHVLYLMRETQTTVYISFTLYFILKSFDGSFQNQLELFANSKVDYKISRCIDYETKVANSDQDEKPLRSLIKC